MIRKKIHLLFFRGTYTEMPAAWEKNVKGWRALHPAFDVRVWSEDDVRALVAARFAWFLPTFDGLLTFIERVDAGKYAVLAAEGGVYADLDISPLRDISPLLAVYSAIPGVRAIAGEAVTVPGYVANDFLAAVEPDEGVHAFFNTPNEKNEKTSENAENAENANETGSGFFSRVLHFVRARHLAGPPLFSLARFDWEQRVFYTTGAGALVAAISAERSRPGSGVAAVAVVPRWLAHDEGRGTNYFTDSVAGSWHHGGTPTAVVRGAVRTYMAVAVRHPLYSVAALLLVVIFIAVVILVSLGMARRALGKCRREQRVQRTTTREV